MSVYSVNDNGEPCHVWGTGLNVNCIILTISTSCFLYVRQMIHGTFHTSDFRLQNLVNIGNKSETN